MIKPVFVFLAPLGCLLMLVFMSLTPFRMMSSIGDLMQPESRVSADVTSMAPAGGVGAVMFGIGMMSLTLIRRKPRTFGRMLLVFAALMMVAGAASNLLGDWLMMSAFRDLATAESIDQKGFVDSFRWAKIPMLVGHGLLLLATIGIAAAARMMEASARLARTAVAIGAISFLVLLLMVSWGQSSILPFSEIIAGEQLEPSILAGSMVGALRSDFLFQGSIVGFAVSVIAVGVSRRSEPALD